MYAIEHDALPDLFTILANQGYTIIGPTVRDETIVLDTLRSVDDLPLGKADEQGPASYRLMESGTPMRFGVRVGPHSWKRYLYPPKQDILTIEKEGKGFVVHSPHGTNGVRYAFIGVRPCELHALTILDDVLLHGEYTDASYAATRGKTFIVAVNCLHPGNTCFCASMQTGPRAQAGYDLALTELAAGPTCTYFVETGSEAGNDILAQLKHRPATNEELEQVQTLFEAAVKNFRTSVDLTNIHQLLNDHFDHAHWDDIARRCMACANCTMVCPTCFCSTTEDITDLTGVKATRMRRWDSCFTADFTKIAGGNIRMNTRTRYRQWLMHKFAHWQDQFNSFGCVGCGRCITWCPAGIDLTKEISAIRETSHLPTSV